jgi:hypothetical protein
VSVVYRTIWSCYFSIAADERRRKPRGTHEFAGPLSMPQRFGIRANRRTALTKLTSKEWPKRSDAADVMGRNLFNRVNLKA